MALSTNQQNDVNTMCSRAKEFSIGSRLTNMTTAGAYDDGTASISAGTISDGTASLVGGVLSSATLSAASIEGYGDFQTLTLTDVSSGITANISAGFYDLSVTATDETIAKLTSTPTAGDVVTIAARHNTAGTTSAVVVSTADVIGIEGNTAKCVLKFADGDCVQLAARTTTLWRVMWAHTHSTNAWGNHALATVAS